MGVFNRREVSGEIDCSNNIITKGTIINGNIISDGNFRLDGILHGDIDVKTKLSLGKTGEIQGFTKSKNAIIEGKVKGNLEIVGILTLKNTAIILGDITTQDIIIEKGARIVGKITTPDVNEENFEARPSTNYSEPSVNGQYKKTVTD